MLHSGNNENQKDKLDWIRMAGSRTSKWISHKIDTGK